MATEQLTSNRILVIDDNEAIHSDFRKIFAQTDGKNELDELDAELFGDNTTETQTGLDFELCFASQGKEGFELLKAETEAGRRFNTAFVDMRMPPGWDGVETIEHLWQVDPDLQIVICTAYSDRSWDEIFQRLGRTDKLLILKKPFDEIEVTQLATALCEKRRLLQESQKKLENLEETVGQQQVEIKAAHQDAENLIDSMSSILISIDENDCVSRWNPVAVSTFNIPIADAIGKKFHQLNIRWCKPDEIAALLSAKPENEKVHTEVQFLDEMDTTHTLDIRVCRIGQDATCKSRLILAADVSHQKNLQAQLDQAQRLESVGQLAAGVAHEINTPMQYIGDNVRYVSKSIEKLDPLLNCLPALVDDGVSDEQLIDLRNSLADVPQPKNIKSTLKQIPNALSDSIEGVKSVSRIVAAMKEFSHPGNDEKSQVCLNHILDSTVTVAKNEWKYVAEVKLDLQDELPKIAGLPSELNQAFLNIIVNAAHAIGDRVAKGKGDDKGLISVKTVEKPDCVEVVIEDNGGGIPANARERVFEPFFTTKDVGKGTGQGLAIAHSVIVQKHGGKLWFDVEEDVGTKFTIQIPRVSATEQEERDPPVEPIVQFVTSSPAEVIKSGV